MANDVFILSNPEESWRDVTEGLIEYVATKAEGQNVGFHEGNHLTLQSGEFFRSVGVPDQHVWMIEVIQEWCRKSGKTSGLVRGTVFDSPLGSFDETQYRVARP